MSTLNSNSAHLSVFGAEMQSALPEQDMTVEMWTKWVAGGSDWAGPISASQDDGGTENGWNIQTRCKDASGSSVSCATSRRIEFSLSTDQTNDGDGAMAYLGADQQRFGTILGPLPSDNACMHPGYPGSAARCTLDFGEPIFADLSGSWTHLAVRASP